MSGRLLWVTAASVVLMILGFVGGVVVSAAPRRDARGATGGEPRPTVLASPKPVLSGPPPGPLSAAKPGDPVHMTLRLDRTAVLRGGDGQVYAELELSADQLAGTPVRAPTDFVVVIDRSGSMEGDKLAFAKQAAESLVERLLPDDRFALISYDDRAQRVIGLAHATPLESARFVREIRALSTGGSTNLSSGLDRAIDELSAKAAPGRMRRVLLLSDGLANQGDTTPHGLSRRAVELVQRGAVLSTMGIGDDFDQGVMSALSEAGSGNFYYLAKLDALPEFFQSELKAASMTVASNLTVQFVPGAYVKLVEASGYSIERRAGEARFSPGALWAGQKRSIWLTLSVPTDKLASFDLGTVRLTYQRNGAALQLAGNLAPRVGCVDDQAQFQASIVRDVWERAVRTEEYGKYQRELSEAVQNGTKDDVDRVAAQYRSKNRQLAAQLGSQLVLENVNEADKAADDAKQAQQQSAAGREISSKRMKASSGFKRFTGAYMSDPSLGLR